MAEPGTARAKPAFSLREDDLVTLLIGPDEQKLVVHESCITRNSDFFKAAMKEQWIEGQMRTIKLPLETCLENFADYLNFAYHGKLSTESIEIVADNGFIDDPFTSLADTYVLGERMLDRSIQNAVVHELLRLVSIPSECRRAYHYPGPRSVATLYVGTSAGSPARRLMVDLYVKNGLGKWNCSENCEFLTDLWKELMNKTLAQKKVLDFRNHKVAAEDYLQ